MMYISIIDFCNNFYCLCKQQETLIRTGLIGLDRLSLAYRYIRQDESLLLGSDLSHQYLSAIVNTIPFYPAIYSSTNRFLQHS
jgi:hypothetical protein